MRGFPLAPPGRSTAPPPASRHKRSRTAAPPTSATSSHHRTTSHALRDSLAPPAPDRCRNRQEARSGRNPRAEVGGGPEAPGRRDPPALQDVHQRPPARGRHVRGRGGPADDRGAGLRAERHRDRVPDGRQPLHGGHRHAAADAGLLEGRREAALRQRRLVRRCHADGRHRQVAEPRERAADHLRRGDRRRCAGLRARPLLLQARTVLPAGGHRHRHHPDRRLAAAGGLQLVPGRQRRRPRTTAR